MINFFSLFIETKRVFEKHYKFIFISILNNVNNSVDLYFDLIEKTENNKEMMNELNSSTHFYNFSVSSGTALNKSATSPWSATWKIGASGSLLIATIVLESFIPAKC